MLEKLLLGVILVVVLAVIVRSVIRALASSERGSKPPSCAGCPFDSKCEMQDKPHADGCGSDASE
jgi:hypothetical protein